MKHAQQEHDRAAAAFSSLAELSRQRLNFQASLFKLKQKSKVRLTEDKYKLYIKDILFRPDNHLQSLLRTLQITTIREKILKAEAFFRLAYNLRPHNQNPIILPPTEAQIKKQIIAEKATETQITEAENRSDLVIAKKIIRLIKICQLQQSQNIQKAFMSLQLKCLEIKLIEKQKTCETLRTQLAKAEGELTKALQSTSTFSTSCESTDGYQTAGNPMRAVASYEKQLKDKDKEIRVLMKANQDMQKIYEEKIGELQDELSKLNFQNDKLLEELENARERLAVSNIGEGFCENSMSMEILHNLKSRKELQAELSEKYLKQVIILKENLESIKNAVFEILLNGMRPDQRTLKELVYLLNLSEQDKTILRQRLGGLFEL